MYFPIRRACPDTSGGKESTKLIQGDDPAIIFRLYLIFIAMNHEAISLRPLQQCRGKALQRGRFKTL